MLAPSAAIQFDNSYSGFFLLLFCHSPFFLLVIIISYSILSVFYFVCFIRNESKLNSGFFIQTIFGRGKYFFMITSFYPKKRFHYYLFWNCWCFFQRFNCHGLKRDKSTNWVSTFFKYFWWFFFVWFYIKYEICQSVYYELISVVSQGNAVILNWI